MEKPAVESKPGGNVRAGVFHKQAFSSPDREHTSVILTQDGVAQNHLPLLSLSLSQIGRAHV